MYQEPLPARYTDMSEEEIRAGIQLAKHKLGDRLIILGHHYQRDAIIEHADFRGDSYKLAKYAAANQGAEFIVFCGVHFMAESADILTSGNQKVILPNLAAGCSMADMANLFQVRAAWKKIHEIIGENETVIPVTYINSAANLKGFVGEHGGTVCTSTNAPTAVEWALEQGTKMFFFPDQHLGRNTGVRLGYSTDQMIVWDPFKPLGGNTEAQIRDAKFILWKGHCSVHKRFTVEQIDQVRAKHPGIQVIVHPECELEVVAAADMNGSTEFILDTIKASAPSSIWAVGTEINLVNRLAREMPDRTIVCLDEQICPCSTMYRIHPSFLLWVLENLVEGKVVNQIIVAEKVRENALIALQRMLTVCA